jgi:N-acetyl-anhydromuramyl-L-alanine amidase AmpD
MTKASDNEAFASGVQDWLRAGGFYAGKVDGWAGSATRAAWDLATGAPPFDRSLRLPPDQYIPGPETKSLIVLHHTAGASAESTFRWWATTAERIGVAFIVRRDGAILEVMPPEAWAYHLGLRGTGGRVDRRSIGIEMACEGGLIRGPATRPGQRVGWYAFGVVAERTEYRGPVVPAPQGYRGYDAFAAYTPAQLASAIHLVDHLCNRFSIPRQTPADFVFDAALLDYVGVVGHHHLRADKSDLHPGFDWPALLQGANLEEM